MQKARRSAGLSVLVELLRRYSNDDQQIGIFDRLAQLPVVKRSPVDPRHVHKLDQRLDPALVAELVAAYESGTPTTQLTKTYGLGKGSVLKLLREGGVQMRNQGLEPADLPEAIRRYETGESLAVIGARFGCDRTVIRRALTRAGVTIRPRPGWS